MQSLGNNDHVEKYVNFCPVCNNYFVSAWLLFYKYKSPIAIFFYQLLNKLNLVGTEECEERS